MTAKFGTPKNETQKNVFTALGVEADKEGSKDMIADSFGEENHAASRHGLSNLLEAVRQCEGYAV